MYFSGELIDVALLEVLLYDIQFAPVLVLPLLFLDYERVVIFKRVLCPAVEVLHYL